MLINLKQNVRFFSEEEEVQLKEVLGFQDSDLKIALDCCSYIFEQVGWRLRSNERMRNIPLSSYFICESTLLRLIQQAAFSSTGPEPLFEILLEAGFDEPHAKVG